jgi:hypothetical protein
MENDNFFEAGTDWLVWRKRYAGKVCYQLLKSGKNG